MIEFKNVSKTYPNGTKGLQNVNLKIEQGEFIAKMCIRDSPYNVPT